MATEQERSAAWQESYDRTWRRLEAEQDCCDGTEQAIRDWTEKQSEKESKQQASVGSPVCVPFVPAPRRSAGLDFVAFVAVALVLGVAVLVAWHYLLAGSISAQPTFCGGPNPPPGSGCCGILTRCFADAGSLPNKAVEVASRVATQRPTGDGPGRAAKPGASIARVALGFSPAGRAAVLSRAVSLVDNRSVTRQPGVAGVALGVFHRRYAGTEPGRARYAHRLVKVAPAPCMAIWSERAGDLERRVTPGETGQVFCGGYRDAA